MTNKPSLRIAAVAATAAIGFAAAINASLALLAGDTLVVPGELGPAQIILFTVVMIVPAALVLWALPRWFPTIVLAVAVLTLPFPFMEFGTPIALWLGAMHLITGGCAAVLAPRIAARGAPTAP